MIMASIARLHDSHPSAYATVTADRRRSNAVNGQPSSELFLIRSLIQEAERIKRAAMQPHLTAAEVEMFYRMTTEVARQLTVICNSIKPKTELIV